MKKIFLLSILSCIAILLGATTYTSVISGDWNDPNNWDPVGVPNVTTTSAWPGDNVIIEHEMTYFGNLTTAKKASFDIKAGGKLIVTGVLDINNTSSSTFLLRSGGNLETGDLIISTCCNTVTLNGSIMTGDFSYTGSIPVAIGGDMMVTGDFYAGVTSRINFTGGSLNVANSSTIAGSTLIGVDGDANLNFGTLSLTGDADIKGENSGGTVSFNSVSFENSSSTIQCVSNSCNYNSTTAPPPNPLDLVTGVQALPVVLGSFTVVVQDQAALLQWNTETESDNDYFLIEHSTDGRTFTTLGTLQGAGNSLSPQYYKYQDDKPTSGVNYYRLWQFDFDGTNALLGIRQFEGTRPLSIVTKISPNPIAAGQMLRLEMASTTSPVQVSLLSSNGKRWSLPYTVGQQGINLPAYLPAGMYYLRIQSEDQSQTLPVTLLKK